MEITNNKYNTMPEQVQENKDNIKVLAEYIKEAYNATTTLETMSTTINASMVRDWVAGTTKGFILDQAGKLFKIVAVSDNTIFIQWWASLPQGATGATGARGETGAKGDKGDTGVGFNNTTDINLVVGEPLSVTYDTEDGITITSQGGIEADGQTFTPTVENNVPLIAGNGLTMDATEDGKHVDVHLSAETQSTLARALKMPTSAVHETKLVAIDNTNAQAMLSIGTGLEVVDGQLRGLGGEKKYLHNICGSSSAAGGIMISFSYIDNSSTPLTNSEAVLEKVKTLTTPQQMFVLTGSQGGDEKTTRIGWIGKGTSTGIRIVGGLQIVLTTGISSILVNWDMSPSDIRFLSYTDNVQELN